MSDQMDGLSNHALQNSASNLPVLFMCGECLQLFLDLDEGTQHWRKCKSNSKTGDLCLTSGTLKLSIDVVRNLVGSQASSLISNETSGENQQLTDSMNEPATTRSVENQSSFESNYQQFIRDIAHPILEQTGLNGLVDDQSITAVNETNIQNHFRPEVIENQQSTDSVNELDTPRNIANQSAVESNYQQFICDNAHPILEQTGLNDLVDNQSITAVNETSVQNHSRPEVIENQQSTDSVNELDTPRNIANQSPVESNFQQSIRDNAHPIHDWTGLSGLADNQPITAVNEASIQNHSGPKIKENPLAANMKKVDTKTSSNHHSENSYKCQECSKSFSNKQSLNKHAKFVHLNLREYKCEKCTKCFVQKSDLNRHFKAKHGPFMCEKCIKFFEKKSDLNKHTQTVHRDIRPFKCENCIESFEEKADLNKHTQTVHRDIRPFKCENCIKSFTQKRGLYRHTHTVHRDNRQFKCEKCIKSFRQKANLNRHIQAVHQGNRPFKCKECSKSFSQKSHLNKHIKSCKPNSETGDFCLTSDTLELSIDVVKVLVESASNMLIPNETNGENQQSTDSMNEPATTRSIANQSPVESNNKQSIGDNAHPILEQTGLNGLVDDQSITAVNETCIQNHYESEVKESQQLTDSINEPATTRSIENQSPVESNHQQSTRDNVYPILKQALLNGLVDDQSFTAVNETSIQNHSRAEVEENPQPTYSINESTIPRNIANQSSVELNNQQSSHQSITAVNETSIQNHSGFEVKEIPLDVNLEDVDTKTSSNYHSKKPMQVQRVYQVLFK